jgi:hypothetical protein
MPLSLGKSLKHPVCQSAPGAVLAPQTTHFVFIRIILILTLRAAVTLFPPCKKAFMAFLSTPTGNATRLRNLLAYKYLNHKISGSRNFHFTKRFIKIERSFVG